MPRERNGQSFIALSTRGGILPAQFLSRVAALRAPHQSGADYGLSKSLSIKDEIARYWRIANDLFTAFQERRQRGDLDKAHVGVDEWLVPLLRDVFGFKDLAPASAIELGERHFPITHEAFGAVPLVLTTADVDLDRADVRFGDNGRRRAAHNLMQELLNSSDSHAWGIISNGSSLRLLRDNPSLSRPAYVEADLQTIFQEQLYADFAALWLLGHATRLRPVDGDLSKSILDGWRKQANEEGERALGELRDGVIEALLALGNGFLENRANEGLREAITDGSLTAESYFQELLRLVYRLLFLFAAEERHLLHSPTATDQQRELYRDGYALALLRDRAQRRRHYDRHADLWSGLLLVFRGLADGQTSLGLPALGGLFAFDQCPRLDRALLSNARLLEATRALAYFRTEAGSTLINYRDMGAEELGSVYESLLELHPYLSVNERPWKFGFVGEGNGEKTKGSARKLTGSYYTPAPLVNELIKSALEPVMAQAVAASPGDPRAALLNLKVVDPACGSGHFLLAMARRIAAEIARIEARSDTPEEAARQHALREVVQHCIHGVDRNPLAVELCRTALWIETVEPGKPLTFLDSHILCGDSLMGILNPAILIDGIPDDAYKSLTGDDAAVCRDLKKRNRQSAEAVQGSLFDLGGLKSVADITVELDAMPEETLEQIAAKRVAWETARAASARRREELRANLFVGAFFAPKTRETIHLVPITEDLKRLERGMTMRPNVEAFAADLAERYRFFHWHVAFAEIMRRGGFDVALGNPPWEVSQLGEEEYFASRAPRIACLSGVERKRAIAALAQNHPRLWNEYRGALRAVQAANAFARSGRFPLTAHGKLNTYALFAETFLGLHSQRGRAGFIVPTGIATEDSTRLFFDTISKQRRLVSLFDFENRESLFPAVDSRMRFSLVTLASDVPKATFVFFASRVGHLTENQRLVTLSPADIALLNPNTRTAPLFRSTSDAELNKKVYKRMPVLVDDATGEKGNPWSIELRQGLFNMTSDSGLFHTMAYLEAEGATRNGINWLDPNGNTWIPLYEAKMIHYYDHRFASYEARGNERGYRVLPEVSEVQHRDPQYEPQPFYWVKLTDVHERTPASWKRGWFFGFKNVTSATNERTLICGLLPYAGVGNSLPLIFASRPATQVACLVSNLSSLVVDYIARQKVGGVNLSFFYVTQLPVLPPNSYSASDIAFISGRVLELSFTSEAMRPFARDLGFEGIPFVWDSERREILKAELDAYYGRLYGLTRDEMRYVLDPSDVKGSDYPSETFRGLKEREIRDFGEYRTARLVLDAWDRIESGATLAEAAR
jgi:hypothetical protein